MKVRIIFYKTLRKIRTQGLLRSLRTMIPILWRQYIYLNEIVDILYKDLNGPIFDMPPRIKIIRKKIDDEIVRKLKDVVDRDEYFKFKDRLTRGKKAFAAIVDSRIIGYAWLSLQDEFEPFLGINIKVNKENGYIYDVYVNPDFRKKGVSTAVCNYMLQYLKMLGYKGVLVAVNTRNIPSMRTFKKMGFFTMNAFRVIRILGARIRLQLNFYGQN